MVKKRESWSIRGPVFVAVAWRGVAWRGVAWRGVVAWWRGGRGRVEGM